MRQDFHGIGVGLIRLSEKAEPCRTKTDSATALTASQHAYPTRGDDPGAGLWISYSWHAACGYAS
jgi:hypothetical protein